jgi:hypothetical protein
MKALLGIFAFSEADFAEIMKLIIAKKFNDDKCKKPFNDKIK